jgi:hypothetical protein
MIVWLAMLISCLSLIIFYTALFKGETFLNVVVAIPAIFLVQTNSAFANKCQKSGQVPAILLTLWILIVSLLSWAYSGKCVEYFAIRHVPNLPKDVYDLINRPPTTGSEFKIPLLSTSRPFPNGQTYFKDQTMLQSILFDFNNFDLLPLKNKYISVHNALLETVAVPQFQLMFDFTYKIPVLMRKDVFYNKIDQYNITFPPIVAVINLKSDVILMESIAGISEAYDITLAANEYEKNLQFDNAAIVFGAQSKFLGEIFHRYLKWLDNFGIFDKLRKDVAYVTYYPKMINGKRMWIEMLKQHNIPFIPGNVLISLDMIKLRETLFYLSLMLCVAVIVLVLELVWVAFKKWRK